MAGRGKMPTTRWTIVLEAGRDAAAARNRAFAELYTTYSPPVYEFIRAMGRPDEDARDLTQGFFATRLFEKNDVSAVDPARGKFRNWLLTAVKHYVFNQHAKDTAQKSNPGEVISIDETDADGHCPVQIGHHTTPERIYERRWAMILLDQALKKLEASYQERDEGELFKKIKPLLNGAGTERRRAIAEELKMREETFNVAVCRCRSRFQQRIRAEIAETVSDGAQIEEELRYLYSCLQAQ